MCLMQTDLPVPDGPRIIEILSFGIPRLRPAQDLVAAERLVDLDELDGVLDAGRALLARVPLVLVVVRPALAADQRGVAVLGHGQPPIGARGFAPQKIWVPSMPMRCTSTMLSTIDLAVAVPTPTGPPDAL